MTDPGHRMTAWTLAPGTPDWDAEAAEFEREGMDDPEFVAAYRAAQARLEAEDAAQSADTFTPQTREEWIEVAQRGILQSDIAAGFVAGFVESDNDTDRMHRDYATAAVVALLAHLAALDDDTIETRYAIPLDEDDEHDPRHQRPGDVA